jgi:hypothetical protein
MSDSNRQLLTIGVFFFIVVVALLLSYIFSWSLFIPAILVFLGFWTLILASIRTSKPVKYERGPFSTMAMGLILIALGGSWFLFSYNWIYSVVFVLLVLGTLAIAAATKRK